MLFTLFNCILVKPRSTTISGNTTVYANGNNKVTLTCNTDSSNPQSAITWYRNGSRITNGKPQTTATGSYGGLVVSQVLEFLASREMDGDIIECRASNYLSGSDVVRSSVILDILCK